MFSGWLKFDEYSDRIGSIVFVTSIASYWMTYIIYHFHLRPPAATFYFCFTTTDCMYHAGTLVSDMSVTAGASFGSH